MMELAISVAKEAGTMIKNRMNDSWVTEEKSSSFDVVTEVDKAAELLIHDRILQQYPNHLFLGEEEAFLHRESYDELLGLSKEIPFLWIVDPIDGTNNYVQGMRGFSVSIALVCFGELTIGVVYDPIADEMFSAEKGQGAYLNGYPIKVSHTAHLAQSAVATGYPSNPEMRAAVVESVNVIAFQCRTIRSLGSAALQMAYVSNGRLTAFWEFGLNTWDVAAAVLLIQEAGGTVTDTKGQAYSLTVSNICSSNGNIHESLLDSLKSIGLDNNVSE